MIFKQINFSPRENVIHGKYLCFCHQKFILRIFIILHIHTPEILISDTFRNGHIGYVHFSLSSDDIDLVDTSHRNPVVFEWT